MLLTIVFLPLMHSLPRNPPLWGFWGPVSQQLSVQVCLSAGDTGDVVVSEEQWLEPAGDGCEKRSSTWQVDCRDREL